MPEPFFTTNDSDITQLEGLYIKERNPPAGITGVNFGAVSVAGTAIRGPVDRAVYCSSPARVLEVFGGRDQGSGGPVTSNIWKTLINKPFGPVWITRVAAAAGVVATHTFSNVTPTAIIRVDASSKGIWGNNITAAVEAATDGNANHFNLRVNYLGRDYVYQNLNVFASGDDNLATVIGTDDGNPVVVTKLASGRPLDAAATALTGGTEGTVADSDYTATGRGINVANAVKNTVACWVAEYSSTAVKDQIEVLAATRPAGFWILGADTDVTAAATAITEVATRRNDDGRIYYAFNHPYTTDPEAAIEMLTRPESWLAAVLSQTDVDIHPGEEDTKKVLAGITRLSYPALERADYIALRAAGIIALEEDEGFSFVSGVTTSLVPGKEQGTRRRMTDYIQLSLANNLKHDVKKKNTVSRRALMKSKVETFLREHQRAERVVDTTEDGSDNFLVDNEVLNTANQRALGVERIFVKVRCTNHILHLVVETEIGTGVTVREAA